MVRIDSNGGLRDSRPCLNCFNKLNELGIKRVIYSTNDATIESKKLTDYHTDKHSFGYKFVNNLL